MIKITNIVALLLLAILAGLLSNRYGAGLDTARSDPGPFWH